MAVRIRMKKLGRRHRPFFRICAIDQHSPRDGRVIEELGTYDPLVPEVDARALLKGERIKHWLSVGAQPSDKVGVLIKKYGPEGTHLTQQAQALERLSQQRSRPEPPTVMPKPVKVETADEATTDEATAESDAAPVADETPAPEQASE